MGAANVLVVAPYNAQVNRLKQVLPADARVGTVDKFQGQQAEAVIVSMTTSSGEDLPRNMAFLFSKNRLNVAISRARCLALVVASPKLAGGQVLDAGADGAGEYAVLGEGVPVTTHVGSLHPCARARGRSRKSVPAASCPEVYFGDPYTCSRPFPQYRRGRLNVRGEGRRRGSSEACRP